MLQQLPDCELGGMALSSAPGATKISPCADLPRSRLIAAPGFRSTAVGHALPGSVLPIPANIGSLRLDWLVIGDSTVTLDTLKGGRNILHGRIAAHGGRIGASDTSTVKRLVNMLIAVAVILLISIGGPAAQPRSGDTAAQPKRILLLYSFGQNFQPWAAWGREIRSQLYRQSPWPLDIQDYSLVTARNGDAAAEAKFVEYLNALYAQRPPDLIIALGAPAARFVQKHRAELFPTTPMLLAVVEMRRVDPSMLSEQDAVVGVRFDQVVLFENILTAVARDEDHCGDKRKLSSRAILDWRDATGTEAAAGEQS